MRQVNTSDAIAVVAAVIVVAAVDVVAAVVSSPRVNELNALIQLSTSILNTGVGEEVAGREVGLGVVGLCIVGRKLGREVGGGNKPDVLSNVELDCRVVVVNSLFLAMEGKFDDATEGLFEDAMYGFSLDTLLGKVLAAMLGASLAFRVGSLLGESDGMSEATLVGWLDGEVNGILVERRSPGPVGWGVSTKVVSDGAPLSPLETLSASPPSSSDNPVADAEFDFLEDMTPISVPTIANAKM